MQPLPTALPTSSDAVRTRLAEQGLVMHSLWFPSGRERTAWKEAGVPLYLRPLGPDRIELGPRLGTMWASVFSPVFVGHFSDTRAGCQVRWSRRFPYFTTMVLCLWVVLLGSWGARMWVSEQSNGLIFWGVLVFATLMAPIVGWVRGGRALDDGIPWLTALLIAENDEEDW